MALSVDIVKVIVLFGLLLMTLLCGMLPFLLVRLVQQVSISSATRSSIDIGSNNSRRREKSSSNQLERYKRGISFLSCFSAGVFLATCLLDLLPSVRHNLIKALFSAAVYTGFPVAEFVMVMGLFLILIVEQVVLTFKESDGKSDRENSSKTPLLPKPQEQDEFGQSHESDNSLGGLSDNPCIQGPLVPEDSSEGRHNQAERAVSPTHSSLRAMLLVCALSLHSVFEGLTVGLQQSVQDVVGIFIVLLLHKSILSFSLGMNLVQSRISRASAVKSVVVFSIASPVGIAIGIGIDSLWNSVSSGLVHGVLQGVASGTFLYIIFFEILPKEFNNGQDRLLKVLFLIIGYSAVTAILFLSDDTKHPFCVINDKSGQ